MLVGGCKDERVGLLGSSVFEERRSARSGQSPYDPDNGHSGGAVCYQPAFYVRAP